jgi:hypothetical protein
VVTSLESDCSEQGDLTELTTILNSVHTSKNLLETRRVPINVVTIIQIECSEQGDITEMTPIMNSAHTSNVAETARATQRGHCHRK